MNLTAEKLETLLRDFKYRYEPKLGKEIPPTIDDRYMAAWLLPRLMEKTTEPQYDGPPTVRALNRTADRVEAAMRELLPITFASLVKQGQSLVRALREEAENELEEQWPK